jgi:hypothetical protein
MTIPFANPLSPKKEIWKSPMPLMSQQADLARIPGRARRRLSALAARKERNRSA